MMSFILPIYNKNKVLSKCLKSICEQSLKDWEIICVLDGENGEAEEIIHKSMKKKPNHYKVVTIDHGGACKARNEGFKHSIGEFVIFFDADCIIEPHAAQGWVDVFEDNVEVDFIYSGYRFNNEGGAINAEHWDPWLLRIRNFISSCFPVRRQMAVKWDEQLKSLQDWDFWLGVLEKAESLGKDVNKIGKFLNGYAFSTDLPDLESISGKGCTPEVWLDRVDAVKKKHNLKDRDTCVTSISYKTDAIALAKLIGADYQDYPNHKPNKYKNMVQVGFSMKPDRIEAHAESFNKKDVKKYLFWTTDNIHEIYNEVSLNAIQKYAILLNSVSKQFVEDKTAKDLMTKAGFEVEILPLPMVNKIEVKPYPEKPSFLVDIDPTYSKVFSIIDGSLPDIQLVPLMDAQRINDFTGLVHFYPDRTMSSSIKRAILTGRQVISNVKDPFAGFLDDNKTPEDFVTNFVNHIRKLAKSPGQKYGKDYYEKELDPKRLISVLEG